MLTDLEIQEWLSLKRIENSIRNNNYNLLERSFWDSEFTDSLNTAISSQTRQATSPKRLVNFLQTRVRDKIVISGEVPEVKVLTPPDYDKDDLLQAELYKNAIYDMWEHSNITWLQQNRFGYYSSLFGTTPIVVLPHFEHKKVMMSTRHPSTMSAEISSVRNAEYAYVGFTTEHTGSQLLASYPELAHFHIANNQEKYKIHEFFDKDRRLFFVEGMPTTNGTKTLFERIPGLGVEHNLGLIPVSIYGNVVSKDGIEGLSDVLHTMAIEENISDLLALYNEAVRESIDATLVVSGNLDAKPKQMPIGRGILLNLEQGVTAEYIRKTTGNPAEVTGHIGMMTQFFRDTSGFPGVRSGQSPTSSVGTGKQVANLMSMTTDDVNAYRSGIGNALVDINEKGIKILKKLFPKVKQEIASYLNNDQKLRYYYAEDLPDNAKHILKYNPMGFEAESIRIGTLQMKEQGIISMRSAREFMPGINPDEEERRIDFERQKEMALQKQAMDMQTQQQMQLAAQQQQMQQQGQPFPGAPGAPAFGGDITMDSLPQVPEEMASALSQ